MAFLDTKKSAKQTTTNNQIGIQGGGSGVSGGRHNVTAAGSGIIVNANGVGGARKNGPAAGGNVSLSVISSDVEALHAVTDLAKQVVDVHGALIHDALEANAQVSQQAVQAGIDFAAIALPSSIAQSAVDTPVELARINAGGDQTAQEFLGLTGTQWLMIFGIGAGLLIVARLAK